MKGYIKLITGDAIEQALDLPKGSHILKILASDSADYIFKIVCLDPRGYEIVEGGGFPVFKKDKK